MGDAMLEGNISIHAPLRERRCMYTGYFWQRYFNPRSLAGATISHRQTDNHPRISIHAPLRERRVFLDVDNFTASISIHAPLRERRIPYMGIGRMHFISIHAPLRERRLVYDKWVNLCGISIHAPLRERLPPVKAPAADPNFNPRSLAGATQYQPAFEQP